MKLGAISLPPYVNRVFITVFTTDFDGNYPEPYEITPHSNYWAYLSFATIEMEGSNYLNFKFGI